MQDEALQVLAATSGEEAFWALADRGKRSPIQPLLGALQATVQPIELLTELCARVREPGPALDLLAVWCHELVYAEELNNHPIFRNFAGLLQNTNHPLRTVPLEPTPLESECFQSRKAYASTLTTPRLHADRLEYPQAVGALHGEPDERPAAELAAIPMVDNRRAGLLRRIYVPRAWPYNAEADISFFQVHPPFSSNLLGAPVLRALRPDCFTGFRTRKGHSGGRRIPPREPAASVEVTAVACDLSSAYASLHKFAMSPRTHGIYPGVGFARRRLYEGLAALANLPAQTSWPVIEAALQNYHFARFRTSSGWFYRCCFEGGFMALDPSLTELTIAAFTDTD